MALIRISKVLFLSFRHSFIRNVLKYHEKLFSTALWMRQKINYEVLSRRMTFNFLAFFLALMKKHLKPKIVIYLKKNKDQDVANNLAKGNLFDKQKKSQFFFKITHLGSLQNPLITNSIR